MRTEKNMRTGKFEIMKIVEGKVGTVNIDVSAKKTGKKVLKLHAFPK